MIRRYHHPGVTMQVCEDGNWVFIDDHKAEVKKLREEILSRHRRFGEVNADRLRLRDERDHWLDYVAGLVCRCEVTFRTCIPCQAKERQAALRSVEIATEALKESQ